MRLLPSVIGLLVVSSLGCSSASSDVANDEGSADQDVTASATLRLTSDFETVLEGAPTAGKPLRIEYALDRLPQCRGNVGGGGPSWNITGFFSENGGAPKTFEVSTLSDDGRDRVAKPALVEPSQGGDLAIWFQVSNRWGCSEFDSQYGQNFHVEVRGPVPEASASIVFAKDGNVAQSGELKAGRKVKIRYEQDRLPQCRRTERGNPVWTITGFASLDGGEPKSFDTARPEGGTRREIDALVDVPRAGELALYFQVHSLGGCMEYDSKGGKNYTFTVSP